MAKIRITEMGNGFPAAGELVGTWDDGEPRLYRLHDGGSIETHDRGEGNTCDCEADEVDADDVEGEIDLDADGLGLRLVGIEVIG